MRSDYCIGPRVGGQGSLALLAGLLLSLVGVGGLATADARASAPQRPQVQQVLAPMKAFDRAAQSRRSELVPLGDGWAAAVSPCLHDAYAELGRRAATGRLTEPEASAYGWIVFGVAALDAAVELSGPVDAELANAQRAYRRMPLRDEVLRAGARGKARELAALRALRDVDTCRFAQEWADGEFSLLAMPQVAPGLAVADDLGGSRATRAVERASRRLRRLGASRARADDFHFFPLISLGQPAFDEALMPPR